MQYQINRLRPFIVKLYISVERFVCYFKMQRLNQNADWGCVSGGVVVCFGLGAKVGRRVVYYGRMAKRYGFGAPIVPFCHKVVLFRQKNN